MMRTSYQPLAHLVDAAAVKWLAAEQASETEQLIVSSEITQAFRIGDSSKLTFHGYRFLLSITHIIENERSNQMREFLIEVHEIASND